MKKILAGYAFSIWGLTAIAVSNKHANGSTGIVYTCYAVAAVLLIFIVATNFLYYFMYQKYFENLLRLFKPQ